MLKSLEVQRNLISLESQHASSMFETVTQFFPRLIDGVKTFANGIFDPTKPVTFQLVDSKVVERKLLATNYVQLSAITVFTPAGLSVSYLDYLESLGPAVDIVGKIQDEVLSPFTTWVSVLLTNPETLLSLKSNVNIPGVEWYNLEAVQKSFAKCFNKDSKTEMTYGKAFKRNLDYGTAMAKVNDLAAKMARVDRTQLIKSMEELVTLLEKLIDNTRKEPERYRISGPTMNALSELVYRIALHLEFYSIVAFNVQSIATAAADTNDKVAKILAG